MTDLSTSCSSETENVEECDVDAVSSQEQGDSEAVLNCSIKTNEGEKRVSEDDVENKRDIATKEENSETTEENEILDSDKGDNSKASKASLNIVGKESLGPDEMHSNVGDKLEENVSSTSGLCSKIDFNEVETSSNSHEQSSKNEDDSSKAEDGSSKAKDDSSKAEEHGSKAEELSSEADEHSSKADEHSSKAEEHSSKADEHSSKVGENGTKSLNVQEESSSKAEEAFSKVGEECSNSDEQYSTGDKEFSKTDVECSKEDEEFPIADKECSKADREFSKADKEISDADKEIAEVHKEISETEEVRLKSDEEFSVSEEESSQTDEECSQEVEEYSEADEEFSKEVEEYSEAGEEFLKSEVKNTESKETKLETPSSRMLQEGSHVEEKTCLKVEVIAEKGFCTEGHGSDVEEESSYAEEDSFLTDEDSLVTEENSSKADENLSKAEENSSKAEENSSKAEENTKQETSNIAETEMNSNRNNANLSSEVLEENSGTEEVEDEEEGDTETEDGSSQASGTEQEDSEDDGDDDEEDGEADGSDKDAESESGWDEKRHMGDGEEETAVKVERKLDDDEDKANPAYIPRKGAFYEHDSRLGDVGGEDEVKEEKEQNAPGKRLWVDNHKWEHDRFDARQQAPKSAQDLIEAYGFDIRRGAENDIPVRDSMPRTRRPGDKNRFGDFVRRHDSEEHSGDDGEPRYSDRTPSNRNRNRFNNGNRRYQGRRENFRNNDASVGFANSDFPALGQNVEIVVKTNTADDQQVQDRSKDERNSGNFRRRPDRRDNRDEDTEDVEARGRNQYDRRGGAADRNTGDVRRGSDRRGFVDEENEEDFDDRRRSWHERRGGAFESRGTPRFNHGRGRGRGSRGQRGRGDPDGRNRNWQQREENNEVRHDRNDNEYRVRNSRNSESSVVEEIPRRAVGSRDSRQRVDSETSQSVDLESRHSRQKDFDNERSDYGSRGERGDGRETGGSQTRGYNRPRGRGRGNTGRYEGTYDSQEQRSRRGQEHSYRGQRPRQERDNRFRDRDQQEYFQTRTIQNSNISGGSGGRPYSDAKTREEEKQELLSSVTSEIKRMNINERELAARQQQASQSASEKISDENHPGGYWQGRRAEQRGVEGEARTVHEKPRTHQDISSTRPSADDGNVDVRRKPSVIIQTTDAPEMLPPVTCIQTFSKPVERAAPESRPSDRPPNKGWAGGEFTPAWRLQPAPANKAVEMIHAVPSGKPKRYSTSRQKAAGAEAPYTEPINTDYQAAVGPVSQQPLTAALPSRPLPAATYYDSSASYVAAPSFHTAPGLTLGMHQMAAYQMQANAQAAAQQSLYNSQPYMNNAQAAKPGTPIQHMYMPHSGSMLPGPYMSMMNYPSHFPMAPVHLAPGAQPTHMHPGSMPDAEPIEMHRMMYYNQQGIPMSVMQQYVDQSAYMTEQSQVDHNIGPESYIGAGELNSQSQGAHEY